MKKRWIGTVALAAGLALAAGCGSGDKSGGGATPPARKLYWVQFMKGHPVHQLTQIAFREGCRKLGYACEIVGTDGADIAGTIALAEQVLSKGDCAGMVVWTGNPAYNPLIARLGKAGVPVILPHFLMPEGSVPGATGVIGCDPEDYAREAAREIGKAIGGKGAVAVTLGSFNTTENSVAAAFAGAMKELYPQVRVLPPTEEGFDAPKAIGKAVSLLQANPDVVAALSTTGGGPTTWAGAQKETGRKIVAVGMDYTRVNLDLVQEGRVYAVIGQPLWEESFGAAELLDKAIRGEKTPWSTKLPAPFITKDKIAPYTVILDQVDAALKK